MSKKTSDTQKTISKEEIEVALDKIFNSVSSAINEKERKITLDSVDKTLNALFDAVNKASTEGKKIKIPNFSEILN